MKTAIVSTLTSTCARVARVAALPLAAIALPAMAHAQRGSQRELFEWRGNVDQEIRIQMRGGRTSVMDMGPRENGAYSRVRPVSAVPATDGYVNVQVMQGRGRVDVVQQPSVQNGYTTVVRVRDRQGGAGSYDIAAFWQPTGNSGYGNSGYGNYGYGNYGGYGDDGTYGTYGGYGSPYPARGGVRQPVYQSGKPVPGTAQNTAVVYGRYPYPTSRVQPRTTPNGKPLPGAAQNAHARGTSNNGKPVPGWVQAERAAAQGRRGRQDDNRD